MNDKETGTLYGLLSKFIRMFTKVATDPKPEVVADTNAHTVNWMSFQVVEAAVISAGEFKGSNTQALIGVTLLPGFYFVPTTSITLSSGTIIGYRS